MRKFSFKLVVGDRARASPQQFKRISSDCALYGQPPGLEMTGSALGLALRLPKASSRVLCQSFSPIPFPHFFISFLHFPISSYLFLISSLLFLVLPISCEHRMILSVSCDLYGTYAAFSLLAIGTGKRRTATVRAKSFANLFILRKTDLDKTLVDYPETREMFRMKAMQLLEQDKRRRGVKQEEPDFNKTGPKVR